jgi:hypothetical protein
MRGISSGQMSTVSAARYVAIASYLCSVCYLEGDGGSVDGPLFRGKPLSAATSSVDAAGRGWEDPGVPHAVNQAILFNSGVVNTVLSLFKVRTQPPAVLRASMWLLRAVCVGFAKVQLVLFTSLDRVLATTTTAAHDQADEMAFEAWQNSMGWLLTAIFDGSKDTCLRVTPAQIRRMLKRLGAGDKWTTFKAWRLLEALRAVAKVRAHSSCRRLTSWLVGRGWLRGWLVWLVAWLVGVVGCVAG